jgi:sulfhydrogenase subunit alpha
MKIEIGALSRVEGHAGIFVEIEKNKVKNVQVRIYEGPRLIEELVKGKTPQEDLNIVCRICAICTLSHRYAAIRAHEKALDIKVPEKVKLLRTLMHYGEMIESHSLHIFFLSLPDLYKVSSILNLLETHRTWVEIGLKLKKFGNKIMAVTSGRMIHGENPVIGGFGKYPSNEELKEIRKEAEELIGDSVKTVEFLRTFSFPDFFEEETLFMAVKSEDGRYGFAGDKIVMSNGEERDIEEYKDLTNERVVPHSICKRSSYKNKPYSVGALARVNIFGEKLDGEAGKCYSRCYSNRWKRNPLFNIIAQGIEIVFCLEKIPSLVDKIVSLENPAIVLPNKLDGEATGAVEAPRGTLYHHYRIKKGLIEEADIITPTAQFLDDTEKYIRLAVENWALPSMEKLEFMLETIARSYDPCISCSTHLVELRVRESESWKENFVNVLKEKPVFVGFGNLDRRDDALGKEFINLLRENGYREAYFEEEIESIPVGNSPIVIVDAVNFGGYAGEMRFLELRKSDFEKNLTNHKINFDYLKELFAGRKIYILAIQPESIGFSRELSERVSLSLRKILKIFKDSL